MKIKRFLRTLFYVALTVLALVLVFQMVSWQEASAKPKNWVGSWNTEITVVNQNAKFPGLLTFYSDGNVLADETPSPLETSGHGNWISNGKNSAKYTFIFYIGSTEPNQWLKGKVNGELNYDSKLEVWDGPFTIEIVDQAGNEVLSDTGTMNATRIVASP